MKKLKLIDEIVREPVGGAHTNREKTFEILKNKIVSHYDDLQKLSPKELVKKRMQKYEEMGVFNGWSPILATPEKSGSISLRIFFVINTKS